MIDKTKFRETFWEICDERDLYLYNITNEEIDMLLAETIDRFEKHEVSPPAFPCVLCRGEIEKTPRVIALCDACILRQTVEQYAATLKNVTAKKAALKDEVERLRMAVGLATTAVPTMEMDPDHPIEMMQRVVAEVERLGAALKMVEPNQDVREAIHDNVDAQTRAEQAEAEVERLRGDLVEAEQTEKADEERISYLEAEVERLRSGDAWQLLSRQLENALEEVARLRVLIGIGEL